MSKRKTPTPAEIATNDAETIARHYPNVCPGCEGWEWESVTELCCDCQRSETDTEEDEVERTRQEAEDCGDRSPIYEEGGERTNNNNGEQR